MCKTNIILIKTTVIIIVVGISPPCWRASHRVCISDMYNDIVTCVVFYLAKGRGELNGPSCREVIMSRYT